MERLSIDRKDASVKGSPLDLVPATILPMRERHENDIYLASYPKSGNTWCQTCLAALIYGVDVGRTSNELVQTLIPDLHFRSGHYLRAQSPTCFKTHDLPRPDYRRAIYILRDGRDVVTSFHRFLGDARNRPRSLRGPREDDWEWILANGCFNFIPWHEHVRAWRDNPFDADVLTIRYEDMKADPIRVLGQMAEFVGVEQSREQLAHIAEITSFTNMKQRESRFAAAQPRPREIVRRGAVGGYRDEMPAEILARFEEAAGETLRSMGYSTGPIVFNKAA